MPRPAPFTRNADYSDWQAAHPGEPIPGPDLDSEFDELAKTTKDLVDFTKVIQRDDGTLLDHSVGMAQLDPDAFDQLLQPQIDAAQAAANASQASAGQSAASASQADASKVAAAGSAASADASKTAAATSAGQASTSATAAAGSATQADASKTAAAGSATAASGSATAAQGAATAAQSSATASANSASQAASNINAHAARTDNPHNVTPAQVHADQALWNANLIQNKAVSSANPAPGQVLLWDAANNLIAWGTAAIPAGASYVPAVGAADVGKVLTATGVPSGTAWLDAVDATARTTATNAASAASNAQTVANAAVKRAGDTMTGPLILSRDPVSNMEAATRQWVLANAAGITDAPNDGGLYGRQSLAWARALPLAGGTLLGALTLAANAAQPLQPVTLQQAQALVGAYLPLTGGTLTGALTLPAGGSASAPMLAIGGANNGIYSNAGTTLQFTANGAVRWTIGGTVLTATVPIRGAAGTAAAPAYSFSGDTATGFYQPSVNMIALSVGGNDVATATSGKAVSFLGAVTLAQDATLSLQAVTLQQLNAKAALYVPLVGGSITGNPGALALGLTLPANVYAGSIIAAGALTLASAVAWNQYVTASPVGWIQQATGFSGGIELNIATGVMAWMMSPNTSAGATPTRTLRMALRSEGALGIGFVPPSDALPIVATNNGFLATTDSVLGWNAYYSTASSGWKNLNANASALIQFVGSSGTMNFMTAPSAAAGAAPALTTYMALSSVALNIYAGQTYSQGRIYANNGVSFGADNGWEWVSFISGSNHVTQHRSGWQDIWMNADGNRIWTGPGGYLLQINGNGDLWNARNHTVAGVLYAQGNDGNGFSISCTNGVWTNSSVAANVDISANRNLIANGTAYVNSGNGLIVQGYSPSGSNYFATLAAGNPNWGSCSHQLWHIPASTVYHQFTIGSGMSFKMDLGGSFLRQDGFFVTWNAPSDIRIKRNICPTKVDALDIILRIPVEEYDITPEAATFMQPNLYSGDKPKIIEPQHVALGLVAQHVGAILPAMEIVIPHHVDDSPLPIDLHAVDRVAAIPYLIRAMQQMEARLRAVEGVTIQ